MSQRTVLRLLLLLGCFFVLSPVQEALAGVDVFPLYLFLNSPNRSVSVTVTNPTENRTEVWVEFKFGFPVVDDSGRFVMQYVDPPYTGEPAAVTWLKAFPQRFVLQGKESQVVRIMVAPPMGTSPGEYWARIVMSSSDRQGRPLQNPGGNLGAKLQYISQVDIPLHVRFGAVTSSVLIHGLSTATQNGKLNIGVDLSRGGNASYWGTMTIRLRDKDSRIIRSEDRFVAIYRDVVYPAVLDVSGVPPGPYTLEVLLESRRSGIPAQYLLKSEPARYSQSIRVE